MAAGVLIGAWLVYRVAAALVESTGDDEPLVAVAIAVAATLDSIAFVWLASRATGTSIGVLARNTALSALALALLGIAPARLGGWLDTLAPARVFFDWIYVGSGFAELGPATRGIWLATGVAWAALWIGAGMAFFRAWGQAARPPSALAILSVTWMLLWPIAAWRTTVSRPTGDEPHYLAMTESLRSDRDLDVRDDYADHTTRLFFPRPLSPERFHVREDGDRWVPIHGVGLSVLLLPGWTLAGRHGVAGTLALIAALAAAALVAATRRLALGEETCRLAWAVGAFLSPLYTFSAFVYPGVVASSLLIAVFAWGVLDVRTARGAIPVRDIACGVALAAVAFLHMRFLVVSASLIALGTLLGPWRTRSRGVAAWVPAGLTGLLYVAFHASRYGGLNPYGAGRTSFSLGELFGGSPLAGAVNLLMDPAAGLFPRYPALVFAMLGGALLLRSDRRLAWLVLGPIAPFYLLHWSYTFWFGGASAPGRLLLPIVPWIVMAAAFGMARARATESGRGIVAVATAVAAAAAGLATAIPGIWEGPRVVVALARIAPGSSLTHATALAFLEPGLSSVGLSIAGGVLALLAAASYTIARRSGRMGDRG